MTETKQLFGISKLAKQQNKNTKNITKTNNNLVKSNGQFRRVLKNCMSKHLISSQLIKTDRF